MWFILAAASVLCFGLRGILYQWTSHTTADKAEFNAHGRLKASQ